MIFRVSTVFGVLALIIPFVTANNWSRRHQDVARRARGDVDIHKRQSYSNARFTFYDVGLGACGQTNVASDWIVALNVEQYGSGYPGPFCFQSITISYGGKTASATIMDECMGCPWSGLDFSRGLFDYFASESEGVLYGEWWFNDGAPTTSTWTPPSTTWEPPPATSTPAYTPPTTSSTPAYTPPTTSSTPAYTPPPASTTSTTSSTSSTSSASSSINLSAGLASGLVVPTGAVSAPSTSNPQNILVVDDILVRVGILLSAVKNE